MGQLNVMCDKGDKIVEWDENDPESVKRAESEWKKLKEKGYEFFEAVEAKGKRVKRFSKKLGKVIAAPGVKKPADKKRGTRQAAMAGGPNHRLVC
jgi:predicted HAD superfamily phosphohydrolase YqeG